MPRGNRFPPKDMYWFAHGGAENDKILSQRNGVLADGEENHGSGSPTWNLTTEHRGTPEEQRLSPGLTVVDGGSHSSGPSSLEKEERRLTVEERKKNLWEAEQERNDAALKKRLEREAALEARRNASRSTIAFAFGSSIPRNVDSLHGYEAGDSDIMSRSFTAGGLSPKAESHTPCDYRRSVSPLNGNGHSFMVNHTDDHSHFFYFERKAMPPSSCLMGSGALIGDDVMTKSMSSAISPAARGRRKNDLMPTVPYDRNTAPRATASSSTRKRSVSMTRLDQLAQPRRHYIDASKANSTTSGGASGALKDNVRSPNRPLSSASEHSGGTGRTPGTVTLRMRPSPRKPRPISIAGTVPDFKLASSAKAVEVKVSPAKRTYTPKKRTEEATEIRKAAHSTVKSSAPKSAEKTKSSPHFTASSSSTTPKLSTPKAITPRPKMESKVANKTSSVPKAPTSKAKETKSQATKKKSEPVVVSPTANEVKNIPEDSEKNDSQFSLLDPDVAAENEKNNAKRIISEEEARSALTEKRRLAREQAEKEAELERQRLEELRQEEEERLRLEDEEQRRMEEEQIRLLEEHRRQEEEKLRKAIEDQEKREEEEKTKRDEEIRMKAEQEKKAKEEAEKQRLELEEKLRKEEEERAERKKRLEKIMSRTRGKSSNTSPSGSVSGSDQLDSAENAQEGFSSGANSLDSNEAVELPSDHATMDDHLNRGVDSLEVNPTYEFGSDNASLNSNDLMMPLSETASQENSLIIPEKTNADVESGPVSAQPLPEEETAFHLFNSAEVDSSKENADTFGVEIIEDADFKSEQVIDTSMIIEDKQDVAEETGDMFGAAKGNSTDNEILLKFESKEEGEDYQSKESDAEMLVSMMQYKDEFSIGESDVNNARDRDLVDSLDQHRSSLSSDMKLPDPIYETSEDGSVSSEKQQQDSKIFEEFEYGRNQENSSAMDDVFSEHAFLPDPVSTQQEEIPGHTSGLNPFAAEFVFQPSEQVDDGQLESDTVCDDDDELAVSNQDRISDQFQRKVEVEGEDDIHSQSSVSSVVEAEVYQQKEPGVNDYFEEDKENVASEVLVSSTSNFLDSEYRVMKERDLRAEKENIFLTTSISDFDATTKSGLNLGTTGDNLFVGSQLSDGFDAFSLHSHMGNFNHIQQKDLEENFLKNEEPSSKPEDVTFIKSEENGACIGIISSIDHDQSANDFPSSKTHSEQFKSNFESASMTDSEENSSLDSNLSQVMTVENDETGGLKETGRSVLETNKLVYSNGEQHNLFDAELSYNHEHVSKQSVNNFSTEIFSNGHGLDSSRQAVEHIADYVQGSNILSVDPTKNNIFENVDAIDYNSKVSQDHPFLAKGGTNQISGNPFLLQDEQKQSFMTTDFFN